MAQVSIFWDPQGHEVDSLGSKRHLRATDGVAWAIERFVL